MCANASLGRSGSAYFYTLMMNVLNEYLPNEKIRIVDAYNITSCVGCSHTSDGIHYDDYTIDKELDSFMEATTDFLVKKVKPPPR
jgi:hypothetical protein